MVGSELALNGMDWSGAEQWLDAERGLWLVDDYPAGWAKEYGNLSFVVVYNSGHMVPYNRPGPAFDLLLRLLRHAKFVDKIAPNIRIRPLFDGPIALPADVDFSTGTVESGSIHRDVSIAFVSLLLGAVLVFAIMILKPTLRRTKRRGEYEEVVNFVRSSQ